MKQTSSIFTLKLREKATIIYHEKNLVHEYYISLESVNISLNTIVISAPQFDKDYEPVNELMVGAIITSFVTEEGGAFIELTSINENGATFKTWFEIGPPHPNGPVPPAQIILSK
jgi:hypothetical protein